MENEREYYVAPLCRVIGLSAEVRFLQSGGNGGIDPGTDDPWGEDY